MRRISNLCIFYFKEMMTSKLYLGMLFLFFVTSILRFIFRITDDFGMSDYGNLVGEVFVPIGIAFLLYIVFFYRSFSNELAYNVQNFFSDSYVILIQKIIAQAIVHVTVQVLFITSQIGCLWVFYWRVGVPYTSFYLEAAQFLYIYYITTIFIAFVLGIIIAMMLNKSKISFVVIFIVWLLLGPLNTTIFSSYFREIPAASFQSFFYVTVQNISDVYRSYLGFAFSYGTLWKALAWVFLSIFVIGLCSLKWCRISRQRIYTIGTLMITFVLFLTSVFIMARTNSMAFQFADAKKENQFYQGYKQKQPADLGYLINEYEIKLGSPIEVKISFKEMDTTTPSFQLSNAYVIEKIIDSKGESVEFERDGDLVHIKSSGTNELVFFYQIKEPSIQRDRLLLTGSMGWYPKPYEGPIYQYNEQREKLIPLVPTKDSFKFNVYSEHDVITNINKISNHFYQGEANSLFVMQADVNKYEFNQYTIIYPLDWSENKEQFNKIIELTELVHGDLSKLGLDVKRMPEQFIFQSNTGLGQLYERTLVYPTDSLYPIDSIYTTYLTPPKLVEAFVEDAHVYYEWANIVANILVDQYELGLGGDLYPMSFISLSEEEHAIATKVYSTLFEVDRNTQQELLKKWYQHREILDNNWTLIGQFIEEAMTDAN